MLPITSEGKRDDALQLSAKVETTRMNEINTAYKRMLKSDVKYRFVADMSSLRPAVSA